MAPAHRFRLRVPEGETYLATLEMDGEPVQALECVIRAAVHGRPSVELRTYFRQDGRIARSTDEVGLDEHTQPLSGWTTFRDVEIL